MGHFGNKSVKKYLLAVFTQPNCKPCVDLHSYVAFLPEEQQKVIEFFPFKTVTGQRTPWCEELGVEKTPTLVVLHDEMEDLSTPIEVIVGAKAIIKALPATISDYTYVETSVDDIDPQLDRAQEEKQS